MNTQNVRKSPGQWTNTPAAELVNVGSFPGVVESRGLAPKQVGRGHPGQSIQAMSRDPIIMDHDLRAYDRRTTRANSLKR